MLLGKIAVLWGQIDEGFTSIFRWLLSIDTELFDELFGNRIFTQLLPVFKLAMRQIKRPKVRLLCNCVIDQLQSVSSRRNATMHGIWGEFVLDASFSRRRAGTYNHQKPNARFFADQLPKLYRDLVELATTLAELTMMSVEEGPAPTGNNKIYFAPQPPDKRASSIRFERGDRIIGVASKWRD